MFISATFQQKYMKSLGSDGHNLSSNTHVQGKIHRELLHAIAYIVYKWRNMVIPETRPTY